MSLLTLRRFGRKVQAFETALDDGVSGRQSSATSSRSWYSHSRSSRRCARRPAAL
jgi:hypothetical protein